MIMLKSHLLATPLREKSHCYTKNILTYCKVSIGLSNPLTSSYAGRKFKLLKSINALWIINGKFCSLWHCVHVNKLASMWNSWSIYLFFDFSKCLNCSKQENWFDSWKNRWNSRCLFNKYAIAKFLKFILIGY